jgi:hypothetical protein
METYGGVNVELHGFLTSAVNGGECSASRTGRCIPGNHWVGLGAGLDDVERRNMLPLPKIETRFLDLSLYRLSYQRD